MRIGRKNVAPSFADNVCEVGYGFDNVLNRTGKQISSTRFRKVVDEIVKWCSSCFCLLSEIPKCFNFVFGITDTLKLGIGKVFKSKLMAINGLVNERLYFCIIVTGFGKRLNTFLAIFIVTHPDIRNDFLEFLQFGRHVFGRFTTLARGTGHPFQSLYNKTTLQITRLKRCCKRAIFFNNLIVILYTSFSSFLKLGRKFVLCNASIFDLLDHSVPARAESTFEIIVTSITDLR